MIVLQSLVSWLVGVGGVVLHPPLPMCAVAVLRSVLPVSCVMFVVGVVVVVALLLVLTPGVVGVVLCSSCCWCCSCCSW